MTTHTQNNSPEQQPTDTEQARRWRLILGRYAKASLEQAQFGVEEHRLERALDYLYQHEYQRRGIEQQRQSGLGGGLEGSQLTAINWLNQSRKLFPKSTFERMQSHAIERYQLSDLLKNPDSIRSLEPNMATAKALLTLRGKLSDDTREAIRELIRQVVEDILRKIKPKFLQAFTGRRNRFRRSHIKQAQNFDWQRTIRQNLKHYQPSLGKLIIEQPHFNARVQTQLPWEVVLCVDQSGSMMDSVMYSAVCASILAALPSVQTHLVVFDTQVVDLSHLAHDPVEVLLTVQLGGGTHIAQALKFCRQKLKSPQRSIVILISDFEEGGSMQAFFQEVSLLKEQGCWLLGLAALDNAANPCYDHIAAEQLQKRGMQVAAMTPEHLAGWLADVMN